MYRESIHGYTRDPDTEENYGPHGGVIDEPSGRKAIRGLRSINYKEDG